MSKEKIIPVDFFMCTINKNLIDFIEKNVSPIVNKKIHIHIIKKSCYSMHNLRIKSISIANFLIVLQYLLRNIKKKVFYEA